MAVMAALPGPVADNRGVAAGIYFDRWGMNTSVDDLDSLQAHELECEVVRDFAALEPLSDQWQRLWHTDPFAEIFQSFAWNRAWWRAYGQGLQLHCIVVWRGDVAVGFLPLVRENQTLRFLGAPQADYGDILAEHDSAVPILAAALGALFTSGDSKECILEHLSSRSRLVQNLESVSPRLRGNLRLVADGQAPTILIDGHPGVLASLAAKKHLRRHETKLAKTGDVTFRFLETRKEIRRHLPSFYQHQIRRRILHGQQSSCLQPGFSSFLAALVEELDPAEQLRFGILEWAGRPLAYHIGFMAKEKFTMYQQAFDVDAWDCSPGEVLLRRLFLYADQNVSREFDFSVGEEPYKARFANHFKPNFTLYAVPPSFRGRLRRSYRAVDGRVGELQRNLRVAVRSSPRAFQLAKQARRWTGEMRARMWSRLSWVTARPADLPVHRSAVLSRGRPHDSFGQDSDVELTKAKLSDLADLYRENPTFHLSSRLAEYRARLRQGDAVYILRMRGVPVLIAWTAAEVNENTPREPYDCTFLRGRRKVAYRTLISLLAAQNKPSPQESISA
jgi:CelD/BcsL family acetyltransferase involved in cellulose biosynthesis